MIGDSTAARGARPNVLTFLTDPRNPKPEWDDIIRGRTLVLSFVTVGEILHATRKSGWSKKQVADALRPESSESYSRPMGCIARGQHDQDRDR